MNMLNPSTNPSPSIMEKISGHEQVVFCNDPVSGLQAIIAIHDTTLGPALGGCRMAPYSTVDEALDDVLRLSRGMTYKCAAADVDFGGGKAVIIGNPATDKTPELFRAFGRFVDSLGGRFYTGTDMGTTMDDFVHASRETSRIVGIPEAFGGSGDSSIPTAEGVIYGLRATVETLYGSDDLSRASYAVQGLGKVGYKVAEQLLSAGANLYVSDLSESVLAALVEQAEKTPGTVRVISAHEIHLTDADIFVPCAYGGVIQSTNIGQLQCKAICGSANNQLADDALALELQQRGILYAPDYIVNGGGLIQVADELYGANHERVLLKTKHIYDAVLEVFHESHAESITTLEAANRMCNKRIQIRSRHNNIFTNTIKPKWNIRND
ncbi:Glu/Leu/Phe/Val family dehydrogenase [Exiguobacterium antarcticum]|uniref:Glu/Leu/Phe/Val family dehydrogenase n=1 Tax=Exiguobacterium antarcticum TaxID=132920 RepID=UPI000285E850|nr:Glu/Leu/Phe/Val dehydrogenase [Exiguobacterium antarcticum]AFS69523.1 Phenylalanine dehydrogenase [Exiguobacterium antarcticum B7]